MRQQIETLYDVQQLLKQFGFIIYFKDEQDRLEMMEQEINNLYEYELITKDQYLKRKIIIKRKRMNG